jgi:hypothetical protein
MPDANNRLIKQDLSDALGPAELRIAQFKPPAAGPDPVPDPPNPNFQVSIPDVMQQVAEKTAQELTDALFPFLDAYSRQVTVEVLDARVTQIIQNLTTAGTITVTNVTETTGAGTTFDVSLDNSTGVDIPAGSPVYISSAGHISLSKADASSTAIVFGFATAAITTGSSGSVTYGGSLSIPAAAQTGTWVAGDTIYLDDVTAGKLTNVKPTTAGTYAIEVGQITTTPAGGACTLYIMKTSRILN